jgi:hypothetical protein
LHRIFLSGVVLKTEDLLLLLLQVPTKATNDNQSERPAHSLSSSSASQPLFPMSIMCCPAAVLAVNPCANLPAVIMPNNIRPDLEMLLEANNAVHMRQLQRSQPQPPPQHHQPQRQVRFFEARIVTLLVPGSEMSQEERDEIWYQSIQLEGFKTQARNQCRKMRVCCHIAVEEEEKESPRGLEHRVCLERQKNKVLGMRCILKAQSQFSNSDHIAMVAIKCTAWAREVALVEASRDFCEAYHPELTALVPDVAPGSSAFPFALKASSSSNHNNNTSAQQTTHNNDNNKRSLEEEGVEAPSSSSTTTVNPRRVRQCCQPQDFCNSA